MEHNKQITAYLSCLDNKKAERQTEKKLLTDSVFFDSFIDAVSERLYAAPSGLVSAVMRAIEAGSVSAAIKVPVLGSRLTAAACFCSAAVIMLVLLTGQTGQIFDFMSEQHVNIDKIVSFTQNLFLGGK